MLRTTMEVDPKVVEDVWVVLMKELIKRASKRQQPIEMAEDVAQEVITQWLERSRVEVIESPINWCRRAALRMYIRQRDKMFEHISYDGVRTMDASNGRVVEATGQDDERGNETEGERAQKRRYPKSFIAKMVESVTEHRDPATIAEERDYLQKIDPDWEEHLEEGLDYTRGYKLEQKTRDSIRATAESLAGRM